MRKKDIRRKLFRCLKTNKNIIKSPILKTGAFLFFDFKKILFLIIGIYKIFKNFLTIHKNHDIIYLQ